MNNIYIILLFIIIVLYMSFSYINYNYKKNILSIKQNDIHYVSKFKKSKQISNLIDNNKLLNPINKKNNILFLTYDNRNHAYINIHNNNINDYAKKYGYQYKFINQCNKNTYWCKIHLVLDELKTNKYDYVIWLDSDTIIKKNYIDIGNILNSYNSYIFIGYDNNKNYDITNAGVFIIKNSNIGIQFLNDCLDNRNHNCNKKNGKLKGMWAGPCYEQGVMNLLIADKYANYTTLLSNNIIYNYYQCKNDVFIMHLYASSEKDRLKCFT